MRGPGNHCRPRLKLQASPQTFEFEIPVRAFKIPNFRTPWRRSLHSSTSFASLNLARSQKPPRTGSRIRKPRLTSRPPSPAPPLLPPLKGNSDFSEAAGSSSVVPGSSRSGDLSHILGFLKAFTLVFGISAAVGRRGVSLESGGAGQRTQCICDHGRMPWTCIVSREHACMPPGIPGAERKEDGSDVSQQ